MEVKDVAGYEIGAISFEFIYFMPCAVLFDSLFPELSLPFSPKKY
jgi:hypothetical protein